MRVPTRYRPLLASIGVFVLLYAAAAWRYESFFTFRVFFNLLSDNSVLGIVAIGETLVILSGGIDLSVGAVMSASSVIAGLLIMDLHWPPALAFGVTLTLGTALGLGQGALIHFVGIRPFIATLAGMFFARGLGLILHLESISITHPFYQLLARMVVVGPLGTLPLTGVVEIAIFLAVFLVAAYVSLFTGFGRNLFALGGSEDAALLMGLPLGRTKLTAYAASGFCAALGGVVLTIYLFSGSHIEGIGMELDAIAATVIGGTLLTGGVGSVFGTLVGVLIIGTILTVITTYGIRYHGHELVVTSGMTKVFIGVLLLLFVLLQRLLTRRGVRT